MWAIRRLGVGEVMGNWERGAVTGVWSPTPCANLDCQAAVIEAGLGKLRVGQRGGRRL